MGLHLDALFLSIFISPLFVFSSEINHHLDAAKLRISQLETVLEETIQKVDDKTLYLKEIQDALKFSDEVQERISELEDEVKLLWAALRTINFELHVLEDKAKDAENKVAAKALEVEQMNQLITEQWIQVQHLEQMKEFNNRRHHTPSKCSFFKFMRDLHWEGKTVSLAVQSYLTQALSLLKSIWAAFTKYHHQLQGFIKHEMERNEITSALANREVVFFVASALITFPVFGAWILLSS